MSPTNSEKEPFDEAMKRLEAILDELERGELPLEGTVEKFESGMALVKKLSGRLEKMETRIRKLVEAEDGRINLEPFEPETDNSQ
ncbi:exodeoxyribonuclease VII small subunit [candidate division KSB1 bacterium]